LKIALKDEKNMPSIKELATVMESIDTDKNGRINYNEFLASCIDSSKLFTEEHIKRMFKMIDKDGNGYVERSELAELFASNLHII
jgi:Ca2+-binding EF-hand superfamily protein